MAISRVGSAVGTTSATPPAHQAGDVFLAFAYRDGSTTAPTLPSGWTSIQASGANTNSMRAAFKVAAGASETVTGFTSATSLVLGVYRGVDQADPIGGSAITGGASTTITYPAVTMDRSDGSSWVVGGGGHRSTNVAIQTAPSGMTNVTSVSDATDEAALHDTNAGVSSWSATGASVGGTSRGWRAITVELRADLSVAGTVAQTLPKVAQAVAANIDVPETYFILLENGDRLLLESGDRFLLEFEPAGQVRQILPLVTQAATAKETLSGSVAQVIAKVQQAAAAKVTLAGSVAQTTPSVTQAASATLRTAGTVAQTLPAVAQAAVSVERFAGTVAQITPKVAQAAAANETIGATVAQTLPRLSQSASAVERMAAAVAQVTPSVAQQAAAVERVAGTVAQTTPSLQQAVSSEIVLPGYVAQTAPKTQQAAAGDVTLAGHAGTAAQILPFIVQAAEATVEVLSLGDDGDFVTRLRRRTRRR